MGLNPAMKFVPFTEIADKLGLAPDSLGKWIQRFNKKYPNDQIYRWGHSYDIHSLSRALAITNGLVEPSKEFKLVTLWTDDPEPEPEPDAFERELNITEINKE